MPNDGRLGALARLVVLADVFREQRVPLGRDDRRGDVREGEMADPALSILGAGLSVWPRSRASREHLLDVALDRLAERMAPRLGALEVAALAHRSLGLLRPALGISDAAKGRRFRAEALQTHLDVVRHAPILGTRFSMVGMAGSLVEVARSAPAAWGDQLVAADLLHFGNRLASGRGLTFSRPGISSPDPKI